MPSVQENLAQVRTQLAQQDAARCETDIDHAQILEQFKDAFREHDEQRDQHRRARRSPDENRSSRFKFKRRPHESSSHHKGRSRKRPRTHATRDDDLDHFTAHPLDRPPADPETLESQPSPTATEKTNPEGATAHDPNAAFKASLFDALADDEGAAAYWESVYNQPIHIYPRPSRSETNRTATSSSSLSPNRHDPTAAGRDPMGPNPDLEAMTDDEYASYVKQKMWERANPHEARKLEELRSGAGSRRDRDRDRTRNRDEASVRAEMDAALERGRRRRRDKDLARACDAYRSGWDELLRVFTMTGEQGAQSSQQSQQPQSQDQQDQQPRTQHDSKTTYKGKDTKLIWPVPRPEQQTQIPNVADQATLDSIRSFFRDAPLPATQTGTNEVMSGDMDMDGQRQRQRQRRIEMLKAERFKWHPDKIAHRFGKLLDREQDRHDGGSREGKLPDAVTAVFRVVDELLSELRGGR